MTTPQISDIESAYWEAVRSADEEYWKSMHPGEEEYWEAVRLRDSTMEGKFWYAVKTTGVYCRPACPSRLPRRENVEFFSNQAAARNSGYRPCKRCKPDQPAGDAAMVRKICRYIETHLNEPLTLDALAEVAGISPFHLQRKFKAAIGVSPREYADERRLGAFKASVREGGMVTSAVYDAGYGSSSRLYERANAQLGMTPMAYRRGGAGMRIRYTVAHSALGKVLIAATEKGICSIRFTDGPAQLREEYHAADVVRDDESLAVWRDAVLAHLSGDAFLGSLPLDIQATAFQRRVWDHLRTIPAGKTESYAQVAAAIDQPSATRAVARACATNPVAVAVPCHRVVRSDGGLGGYRWGIQRKKKLLRLESA